jgi:UDP-2,4-diacetamido-2,4,6-trideoxy-beta-L-altropyranose hydrolase
MSKNILFRADSSSTIGTGHIMRDLVLASKYKDANITFATQNLEGNINYKIIESNYKLEILNSNSIDELDSLIKKLDIDLLIIDHYDIDYTFEKELKTKNPNLKILSFDDTYEKHHCDILLNHNISADSKRYTNLVPKTCELRCGSDYTLLREEFIKEKTRKTIFLAMGGSDSTEVNLPILKILTNFKNIEVNLVTTTANSNIYKIKQYSENKPWIKIHINSNKIAKLMKKSDLAIITPSVIANEIIYMELDFIAIKVADNQNDIYEYFKENNYFSVLKNFNEDHLTKLLIEKGIK